MLAWGGSDSPAPLRQPEMRGLSIRERTQCSRIGNKWFLITNWPRHKEARLVQIPPVLVGMLREHLDRFGAGPDGRLFRSPNGGVVSSSTHFRVWDEAPGTR